MRKLQATVREVLAAVREMNRSIGAVRTFAKAAKAANHAPPIKIFGIPGRYAEATYTAASKVSDLHCFVI